MMKLYFIRHGITENNTQQRFNGGNTHSPLTEEGIAELRKTKEYLERQGILFSKIYVSPQQRAIDTMKHIVSQEVQDATPIIYNEQLREIFFGQWEGQLFEPLLSHPQVQNLRYYPDDYDPSEFGGEDYRSLLARGESFLDELDYNDDENYLIVGHGVMLTCLLQSLKGAELSDIRKDGIIHNGSVSVVEVSQDGTKSVQIFNLLP